MAEARIYSGVEISIKRGEGAPEERTFTVATVKLYPHVMTVKVPRTAHHSELLKKIEEAVSSFYANRNVQF